MGKETSDSWAVLLVQVEDFFTVRLEAALLADE
jgi:hypothetical protein